MYYDINLCEQISVEKNINGLLISFERNIELIYTKRGNMVSYIYIRLFIIKTNNFIV